MLHSNISSTILYACCDSTSKVMGTALGPEIIRNKLKNNNIAHEIKVSVKDKKSSFDYCKQIERIAELNNIKLTIGGEHLITFPILVAMARKISKLKLVIFDAHHDAYPYPISTHYSLFYHVWLELKLPMFFIGTRYEVERSFGSISILDWQDIESQSTRWSFEKICNFIDNSPFYLSIDLDVLNPSQFKAVSAPVPGGLSIKKCITLVEEILKLNPVGADIVEYNPLRDGHDLEMLEKIMPILSNLYQWSLNGG